MANVIGIDVGAARPVMEGNHIYDFTPEYHVMCNKCRKAAKIVDQLFIIVTSELIFNNITRWRRLVVGTLMIGRVYKYYRDQELVEVSRRIAVQGHGESDTLYVDFIFRYDRMPGHTNCAQGMKVIIATNSPDNASFSVGYIEDSITNVVLDQAGIDSRIPGLFAITHDKLFEGDKYKQVLMIYIDKQPIEPCSEGFYRVEVRGRIGAGL